MVPNCTHYLGLDLGKWRFSVLWGMIDRDQVLTIVGEIFSQNEDVDTRAKAIHDMLSSYGVPADAVIRADNADPQMIAELNAALERLSSPYLIAGVEARAKIKNAGILRVESLMNRGAFRVRRSLMAGKTWRLGMGAAKPGKPVEGSRLIWELGFWQYPKAEDGKVQKDEPDDATADGADSCDALRYLVMTWLGPLEEPQGKRSAKDGIDQAHVEATRLREHWKEATQGFNQRRGRRRRAGLGVRRRHSGGMTMLQLFGWTLVKVQDCVAMVDAEKKQNERAKPNHEAEQSTSRCRRRSRSCASAERAARASAPTSRRRRCRGSPRERRAVVAERATALDRRGDAARGVRARAARHGA
jgi:hypothetical protein